MTNLRADLEAALGGRFAIQRALGGDEATRAFLADEVATGRRVVLKVVVPELAAVIDGARFRQELLLAAPLRHPHLLPLLTAGEAGGLLYFTTAFVAGESLRVRLARDGRLPVLDATRILRQVAEALAYVHRRQLVHGDLTPERVLLADAHALVTDVGVAGALRAAIRDAAPGGPRVPLGTPPYLAPEQAAADPAADHRVDIYAMGVLAYEMLGGPTPFAGPRPQVLAAETRVTPEPLDRLRPELPPALCAAVMRCLNRDPGARWRSAGELRLELEGLPTEGRLVVPARPRRRLRRPAAAAVVLALAAAGIVTARHRRATPAPSPGLVAVLPFSVRGPGAAKLGEALVSLLSSSLDGVGNLRAADPRAVLGMVRQMGTRPADPASGARVADRLGAGRFVLGSVVEGGGHLTIDASLYEPEAGPAPEATASVEGDAAQLFSLVDGLAGRLLASASVGVDARASRIAAVTTGSLPALAAYVDGEAALREGRTDSAVTAFQRAVAADSGFALAEYRLSIAAEQAGRAALAARAARDAERHSARLSDHDRALLEALQVARRGDARRAEAMYRSILQTHPDDVEAWIRLGEVLSRFGPLLGRSPLASAPTWNRVRYFDPANPDALAHLARIAALERRPLGVDSLAGRVIALGLEGGRTAEMRALRAWTLADTGEEGALRIALRAAPSAEVVPPVWDVASAAGDLAGAETLARLLTEPARSPEARTTGHVVLAYLELARGRLAGARAEIARAAVTDTVRALELGTIMQLAPFLQAPSMTLERARWALKHLDPAQVPPSASPAVFFSVANGLHGLIRSYLLGVVSARLGEPAAAAEYAAQLDSAPPPEAAPTLPHDLSLEVRSEIALRGGDAAQALSLLRQRAGQAWYAYDFASPVVSEGRARYLEATLEAATQDPRSADTLLRTFEGVSIYDLIYAAPARFRQAVIEERAGDAPRAAADYRRFLAMWQGADGVFAPMLDSARAGIARLGAAGAGTGDTAGAAGHAAAPPDSP